MDRLPNGLALFSHATKLDSWRLLDLSLEGNPAWDFDWRIRALVLRDGTLDMTWTTTPHLTEPHARLLIAALIATDGLPEGLR